MKHMSMIKGNGERYVNNNNSCQNYSRDHTYPTTITTRDPPFYMTIASIQIQSSWRYYKERQYTKLYPQSYHQIESHDDCSRIDQSQENHTKQQHIEIYDEHRNNGNYVCDDAFLSASHASSSYSDREKAHCSSFSLLQQKSEDTSQEYQQSQQENAAAAKIQKRWRIKVFVQIYRMLKNIITFGQSTNNNSKSSISGSQAGKAKQLLKKINPSEAQLLCDFSYMVRFRLGNGIGMIISNDNENDMDMTDTMKSAEAKDSNKNNIYSYPIMIYYKIYITGAVCDIGAFAPRNNYYLNRFNNSNKKNISSRNDMIHTTYNNRSNNSKIKENEEVLRGTITVGKKSFVTNIHPNNVNNNTQHDQCPAHISREGWYRRVENNGWRPVVFTFTDKKSKNDTVSNNKLRKYQKSNGTRKNMHQHQHHDAKLNEFNNQLPHDDNNNHNKEITRDLVKESIRSSSSCSSSRSTRSRIRSNINGVSSSSSFSKKRKHNLALMKRSYLSGLKDNDKSVIMEISSVQSDNDEESESHHDINDCYYITEIKEEEGSQVYEENNNEGDYDDLLYDHLVGYDSLIQWTCELDYDDYLR